MKNKKVRTLILSASMIGVMFIGGIAAYFTDADTATNEFAVGKISLDLQEPNWDPDNGENVTPNKVINKDPQIMNDGLNDEYVFMEITIPYANVVTANEDGTKNAAADTELYSYEVKSGWVQLGNSVKDTDKRTVTYLYVYGTATECTALAPNVVTPTLFDTVKVANVVEDQGLEALAEQIVINAYGIQTTDINGGKKDPESVWEVLANQNPSTDVNELEDEKTDIKK